VKPRLVTVGETLGLFRAGGIGGLAHQHDFQLGIGGAESNVAIGVARLGGRAAWIGRVGADSLGVRVLRELRAEEVDVRAVVDDTARTALMVKERPTSARAHVWYYRGDSAGSRLAPDDIPPGLIESAHVLHVTGITPALSDSAARAVDAAIEIARSAGVAVSFDVNHRSSLWHGAQASAVYRDIAGRADIVFAGVDEAQLIVAGESPERLAAEIADLGPRDVIIKLGASGCHALIDGVEYRVPAIEVDAVDTVGAGDAFVAGYLSELLNGEPASTRLATGVRAGAFACLGPGDWESAPRRGDLALLDAVDPVTR
jgi:2-dehydro-3-deoxygluconokinase